VYSPLYNDITVCFKQIIFNATRKRSYLFLSH